MSKLRRFAEELEASPALDAPRLEDALAELDALRARYRLEPDLFAEHLPALKEVGRTLEAERRRWKSRIAEEFVLADEAAKRAEKQREACRALLLRETPPPTGATWSAGEHTIVATPHPSLDVPASGSEARAELEALLEVKGLWRATSTLSRALLVKVLPTAPLADADRATFERLCPSSTTWRLTVRRNTERPR